MESATSTTSQTHVRGTQYVLFMLGDEHYGVPISQVQEIVIPQDITAVPGAPDFVEGVTNLRGQVVPVINLAHRLGLTSQSDESFRFIVVVDLGEGKVGMSVHGVDEVASLPDDRIDPPSSLAIGVSANYVAGLARRAQGVAVLLDLQSVLSHAEVEAVLAAGEDPEGSETAPAAQPVVAN